MNSVRTFSLRLAAAAALVAAGPAFAGSGPVGGSVSAINTLVDAYNNSIIIDSHAGQTDTTIVAGTIDNNSATGWKLTVSSNTVGRLTRGGGAGGPGNEILYTNVKFVAAGSGTLGSGLHSPDGQDKNIVDGSGGTGSPGFVLFNTRTTALTPGTATTATVGYGYTLKISWSADTSLLAGSYTDIITLVLADDI